jgi:hypothetical protein
LARHQATFEHLGRVRKLLRDVSIYDPEKAREAALAFWNHEVPELAPDAKAYLDLLDEWDLLGVAFREKRVDRKLVLESLRYTFRNSHNVDRGFISQTKEKFQNPRMYADLDYLIQCCLRPTWFEWLAATGKSLHGTIATFASSRADSSRADREADVQSNGGNPPFLPSPPAAATQVAVPALGEMPYERSEASPAALTVCTSSHPRKAGRNSGVPAAAAPAEANPVIGVVETPSPVLEETDTMSDKSAIPSPLPPPPPPGGPGAGEIPPFRPPRPRP